MPVTPADIDAAVPPAGTPNRGLTNTALKGLITDIANVGVGIGVGTVNTFADLPAPATVTGQRWWVLTSTGVWLVNRRTKGAYYSDGAVWSYLGDFPVTAVEVGFTPAGSIAASDVQAAIEEVNTERAPGGTAGQVQFNNSGVLGGASKTTISADGNPVLASNSAAPAAPAADTVSLYGRRYAGADFLEYNRPSGRNITLQAHFGLNRIAFWSPGSTTNVNVTLPRTAVGTASHPAIASTNLVSSTRRWRMTSAATATQACDERVNLSVMWRGNAANLGGFTSITRFSLTTLQAGSVGFFGIIGTNAALSLSATLASLTDCVGVGFTQGTHTNLQLVNNDAAGSPTLTDLGSSFAIATASNFYTLMIRSASNGSSIFVTITEETSGVQQNYTLTTDIPSATTFLSPRNYLNNGGVAAAVAYDCMGVYVETDY